MMASGDYTNEELYLLQRLARTSLRTNAIGSFDYYKRGTAFFIDKNDIVPFAELPGASLFLCLFDDTADTESIRLVKKIVEQCENTPKYRFNTPNTLNIRDYAAFFRSVNRYLIQENLAKGVYVEGLGKNYDTYRQDILAEDFSKLLSANNLQKTDIQQFAEMIIHTEAPIFLVWERLLDERGIIELENLCMLLDIQAKPSTGFLNIKAELNSQGLFDMGIFPEQSIGGRSMDDESVQIMADVFRQPVVSAPVNIGEQLAKQAFTRCLLFNATGSEIPEEVLRQAENCTFSLLQTAQWDKLSAEFDLILPASLPDEVQGTFTDTTRAPHNSKPANPCPLLFDTIHQLSAISSLFGLEPLTNPTDIFLEYVSFFQGGCRSRFRHFFR